MTHPMVTQLRFARSEFQRCLDGVTPEDAVKRITPMNSISWIIGHLASQEQYIWLFTRHLVIAPDLYKLVGSGQPASTPDLDEMWDLWHQITTAADPFLDSLTPEILEEHPIQDGMPTNESYGMMLLRNIYHYWFHIGEAHAIRQQLGHKNLPQFVGGMRDVRFQ